MRKLTLGALAIALVLALSLDTPRSVAAQTVSQKVASCNTKMEAEYEKNKPHLIFLVAAKKVCLDSQGDDRVAIFFVNNFQRPVDQTLKKQIDDYNANFDNPKGIKEPGLVGMAGTLLRERLRVEAQALLPALPAEQERIRLAALEKLANDPVYQEKKKAYEECNARNAAAVPNEKGIITTEICTDPDAVTTFSGPTTSLVVTGPTNECTPKTTPSGPVEVYEETFITLLCNDPDGAFGYKIWLYGTLKRITGPTGAKTPGEKKFLTNMINYVRDQNVKVAQGAIDAYDAWKAEGSGIGRKSQLNLYNFGNLPPDFNRLANDAIMGSALAIAVAGAIATTAAGSAIGGMSTVYMSLYALGAHGISAVSSTFLAATVLGAGSVVLVALVVIGVSIYAFVKIEEARPKLEEALAEAWKLPQLDRLLNAPNTAVLIQHYFAKATSKYSPTGLKDPGKGCRACFYEAINYGGRKFCTSGRVQDLKKQTVKLFADGRRDDWNWGDKISSVALDKANCKDAYVKLFEDDRMRGKELLLTRSIANLGAKPRGGGNWNDNVSSLDFINSNAPQCEVCLYSDRGYYGGYYCVQGPVQDLRSFDWSDRASSVAFNTRDCPKAKVWLFEDEEFKGRYVELSRKNTDLRNLNNRANWGRGEWDDDVTSVYFSPVGKNPYLGRQLGGCRVCLYDHTNYNGRWVCADGNKSNAKLKDKDVDLNDLATSIDFQTKDCPRGKAPIAFLYQHTDFGGARLYMDENDPNFGTLKHGSTSWNDSVSSLQVYLVDTAILDCRVCLYEAAGYKGKKFCTTANAEDLGKNDFNDMTSSIKIYNKGCRDAGVTVYEKDTFGGKSKRYTKSTSNVGGAWNDKITGVKFSKTLKATIRFEKKEATQQCRVCFYEDRNFEGRSICTRVNRDDLSNLKLGGRNEWDNDISSIKLDIPFCPGSSVWIFEDKDREGKYTELKRSNVNLHNLNAGGRRWGDAISSWVFKQTSAKMSGPAAPKAPRTPAKKWKPVSGIALDISVGPGGSIWAIGPTGTPWNYTGKRMPAPPQDPLRKMMADAGWKERPGPVSSRIDVGPGGWVWVVGADGYGYFWRNNKWNQARRGGKITDIAVAANRQAWAIGTDKKPGGYSVYKWGGSGQWIKIPGATGVRIDIGPKDRPWIVNDKGVVFVLAGKQWVDSFTLATNFARARNLSGSKPQRSAFPPAIDISVGAKGAVVIALKGGGTAVWTGVGWEKRGPGAKTANVAVGQKGVPWATTDKNQLLVYK